MSIVQTLRSSRIKHEPPSDIHMNGVTTSVPIPHRAVSIASIMSPPPAPTVSNDDDPELSESEDVPMAGSSAQRSTQSPDSSQSSLGIQAIQNQSRELIQAMQKLDTLGISSTLQSLPKFVVVGDQSAGKSSIIEAVCDITLPRSSGTCTRCPFQIKTTSSKTVDTTWTCQVKLLNYFAYEPRARSAADEPYTGWAGMSDQAPVPFATVTNKKDLEDMLRRAQLAILNPNTNPLDFLQPQVDLGMKSQCEFSPNVVGLDIDGPGLPELYLHDLPGAINVHEDGRMQYLVKFIEKLTLRYLKDPKTLVLLAVAANTDVETSTAFRYVTEANAIGRCMGVLTKPDLIDKPRLITMRRILNGEIHKIGGSPASWFVTKQLSQEELEERVSHAVARDREQQFFASDRWTGMSEFNDRFGVPALQTAISRKYTKHIISELPELMARVESRLHQVQMALHDFPQRPASAAHKVMFEINNLAVQVQKHIRNDQLDSVFRTNYKAAIRKCQEKLLAHSPTVVLQTPGYTPPPLRVDDDGEDDDEESPSKRSKANNGRGQPATPQRREPMATPAPSRSSTRPTNSATRKRDRPDPSEVAKKTFTLDEVHQAFERGATGGIPGEANGIVVDWMVSVSTAAWRSIIHELFENIKKVVHCMLQCSIDATIQTWKRTRLYAETIKALGGFYDSLIAEQRDRVKHLVEAELYKPNVWNPAMVHTQKKHADKLSADRLKIRVDEHLDILDDQGCKVPKYADRAKKLTDVNWLRENNLEIDPFKREVDELAKPLAYYEIASSRLLDTVVAHVEYGIMRTLLVELKPALDTSLKVVDEEHCMQLLAEDPEREAQRVRLLEEQKKLEQALEELRGLPGSA